jgi:hypothetical protein
MKWINRILILVVILCLSNFLVFVMLNELWSGNALSGGIIQGQYYLGSDGIMSLTTREHYQQSIMLCKSLFLTQPSGILCALILTVTWKNNE